MREAIRSAAAAVSFLTTVPVGRSAAFADRERLRDGTVLFPVVGAAVGAATGAVAWAAAFVLPPLPAAVLGVGAGALLTGALHLDGLADTADGVGASLTGADPSTAMHDPRLGVFGGVVLILDVVLRISVLAALVTGPRFPFEAIAAGALGRAAAIALLATTPYAGGAGGTGAWTRDVGVGRCLAAVGVATGIGIFAVGPLFGAMVIGGAAVAGLIRRWSRRSLSGMTGDTLGATAELSETMALVAALAIA
ncbi:MAG: cobalamin synthase [Actinomycetia bacterium]|nr:cobalamin synthase [Actinomycetes bacterium]